MPNTGSLPGASTALIPQPRTLATRGKGWSGSQAWPGLAAVASQMEEEEGAALERWARGGGGAGVLCPRGSSLEGVQEPSAAGARSEENPKDSGPDAGIRGEEQAAASPRHADQGAALQRMDSLEETLRELEATLSDMRRAPTAGPPGRSLPLPLSPQVAASTVAFLLPSCSRAVCPQSWRAGGGPGQPPPPSGLLSAPAALQGTRHLARVCVLSPGEAGKPALRCLALLALARQGLFPPFCFCEPVNKVFSPCPAALPPRL